MKAEVIAIHGFLEVETSEIGLFEKVATVQQGCLDGIDIPAV